jgi:hypothetical protein
MGSLLRRYWIPALFAEHLPGLDPGSGVQGSSRR